MYGVLMMMSGSIHHSNRLKDKALARILIISCLLLIFALFSPAWTFSAQGSIATLKPSDSPGFAAIQPISTNISLYNANRSDGSFYKRMVSKEHTIGNLETWKYPISGLHSISTCLSICDTVFKRRPQQACQLLDIPPPFSAHL